MNEVIAKGLKEQLRVLSIYLREYSTELDGDILKNDDYKELKEDVEYNIKYITSKYHL